MIKDVIWVGLGGFLGSALRYLVALSPLRNLDTALPLTTLTVNMVGSLVIGLSAGYFMKYPHPTWTLLLITGFCGGFTTFSTFSIEGLRLLKAGMTTHYLIYAGTSVIGGLFFCVVGWWLAQKFVS